ncbi:MAG: DUF1501 domain-containing protein [Planctomycetaceae bacterium]|nr:DUF1501 domain-containing protein [Planctomycetaceae bacterium]
MLQAAGGGFGLLGLAGALDAAGVIANPHVVAKAKRVIFLFMNGAPSHVDTFDPKPALAKHEGQQPSGKLYKKSSGSGFMPSPFEFKAHGENGVVMSELFPNLAQCADDLTVIRSMHTNVPNHEPGLLMMHCGNLQPIRPCLGSWASYGLGSENANLPAFVALSGGTPVVGPQLWSNSFLPGEHQGVAVDTNDMNVEKLIANIRHPSLSRPQQRQQLDLLLQLNQLHASQRQQEGILNEQIEAMELAFKMQSAASEAFDVQLENEQTRQMYGDTVFGQSCLLARRLVERGVRMVQVYYVTKGSKQPWDTHSNNNDGHRKLCADSDRATAALLADLKQRGLLDDTLVVWTGEFGRTPYSQLDKKKDISKAGRDHHHTAFTTLLAGGGVKGGFTYGATDEVGMHAVENRVHVHDLHATILHLLGIDHTQLTYRYSGRDFRLTDIHGNVVHDVIA